MIKAAWLENQWFTEREMIFVGILLILHLVGIGGMLSPWASSFALLTPINLLVSLFLVLLAQINTSNLFWLFVSGVGLYGWLLEVIGVQTGFVFGGYEYGATLGFGLFGVPLVMMVNWAIVVLGGGALLNFIIPNKPLWLKTILGAAVLTSLDFIIEPVAINFDFWHWSNHDVPLQNYLGWFFGSLIPLALFFRIEGERSNKVAVSLFIIQLAFFGVLNLFS